tara:strand:- start:201 stop:446 length:246 start_codon:yes stop_codon:yes gene_type:complete
MNDTEILNKIKESLKLTLETDDVPAIKLETDLFEEGILDSLDSMVFFMNLQESTSAKFPEDDLVELGLGKVDKLISFIQGE